MSMQAIVAWSIAAFAAVLVALGARAWRTLREGRDFQRLLAEETDEALHGFLSSPRGGDPSRPADILYRLNALMEFERREDPRRIPLLISLLDDPHASVVSVCREALEERTGEKFRLAENETLPDPAAWRAWWERQARGGSPRASGTPPT